MSAVIIKKTVSYNKETVSYLKKQCPFTKTLPS